MREDFSYFQDCEFQSALAAYEHMLAGGTEPNLDAETLTDIAEYYVLNHREEEAYRCIDYALSFYPDSIDPQIFLARQQMFFGNNKEAWDICQHIYDQQDREVVFLKAELMLRDDKVNEAIEMLYDYYKSIDDEEAADFLYDSIVLVKDYNFIEVSNDWCAQLRQDYPDYTAAISLQAEIYNNKGDYQKAVDLLQEHIHEIAYDTQAWLQMAESQWWLDNLDDALEATEYALAINKDDADALIQKGNILYDADRPEEAHQCFLRFLRFFPKEARAIYMDAQCLLVMEQYEEAITQFERLSNTDDAIYRGYTRSYLALCYYKTKNRERMLHYLRLAGKEKYDCLHELFQNILPGVDPKDYYDKALTLLP